MLPMRVRGPLVPASICLLVLITALTAETSLNFALPDLGGVSFSTAGTPAATAVAYARIQPAAGQSVPQGLAIFGFRQGGVLVSEAGVPATVPSTSGRIFADAGGAINTGVAIANPNSQAATVSFVFTDSTGNDFANGSFILNAGEQRAAFIDEAPFSVTPPVRGTLTVTATLPVSMVALRGRTNERGEFLLTTLPVTNPADPAPVRTVFPHFADGGGWTTELILVNTTGSAIQGRAQFFGPGSGTDTAPAVAVTIGSQTANTFDYSIPARSAVKLVTAGSGATTASGSIHITPSAGQSAPAGLAVFSFRNGSGITVSEAGVPAQAASRAFRLYAETAQTDALSTGFAMANPSASPISVGLSVTDLSGSAAAAVATVTLPPGGQLARFLREIPEFAALPQPFRGILRAQTTSTSGLFMVGLRSRTNERADFLITTTPPSDETATAGTTESVLPHLADGGGYTTQFVLYSGTFATTSSGTVRFVRQNGQAADLALQPQADLSLAQTDSPDPALPGQNVTYRLTVTNAGPSPATRTVLLNTLPAGSVFVSTAASQGSCFSPVQGRFQCVLGNLAANATATMDLTLRSDSATTLLNAASVSATESDLNSRNNASSATTLVGTPADLQITKTGPPTCAWGSNCDNVAYRITVQNNGPGTATGVIVTDILPVDPPSGATVATLKSASPSQGTCSAVVNGRFTCNLGSLANRAIATIDAIAEIDSTATGRVITNNASVTTTGIDAVGGNNQTAASMNVTPSAAQSDLELSVLRAVRSGTEFEIQGTYVNRGPSTATQVRATTTFSGLQALIALGTLSASQGTFSISGADVILNSGTVVKNVNQNFTIRFRAVLSNGQPATGPLTITTVMRATEVDPVAANGTQVLIVQLP